ncbi:TRAP transporter small permease [Flavobacteriaceae bacterium]|nr:TRAP transporter small permease [Flavobacteriaceae bacterium]
MKNLRQRIDKWVGTFLVIILSIMVVNVLWQVFTRFFTTSPSSFTEELARYLMIWLGILGGAYVAGKNEHVAITVFTKKQKPKRQQQIQLFVRLTIVTFAFVGMVIGGCRLVFITFILNQYSPALGIPLAAVYAVIPISGLLIMFYKLFPTNA